MVDQINAPKHRFLGVALIPYNLENKSGFIYVKTAKDEKWGLPGGKIDLFEEPERAVIREVREETGLDVLLEGLIGIYPFESPNVNFGIALVYSAKIHGGNLNPRKNEIRDIVSADLKQVRDLYFSDPRQLRSTLNLQALEDYLQRGTYPLDIVSHVLRK